MFVVWFTKLSNECRFHCRKKPGQTRTPTMVHWWSWKKYLGFVVIFSLASVLWCEYLIYYATLRVGCQWPDQSLATNLSTKSSFENMMILSDPHLIGSEGTLLDRWFRRWQMSRSFHAATELFKPRWIFILGDIFNEGQWETDEDFQKYVQVFERTFETDDAESRKFIVVGNHDVGFHYDVTPNLNDRFKRAMNVSTVDLIRISTNGQLARNDNDASIYFVRLNSMAMDGDRCWLCREATKKIEQLSKYFHKLRHDSGKSIYPILLTHFPLYRPDESVCLDDDIAPESIRYIPNREKIDCFSKEASEYLLQLLEPRLIINGHVHYNCRVEHRIENTFGLDKNMAATANQNGTKTITELTVSSFSWRNRQRPSFLLFQASPYEYLVGKCFLYNQLSIYWTYGLAVLIQLFVGLIRVKSIKRIPCTILNKFLIGLQKNSSNRLNRRIYQVDGSASQLSSTRFNSLSSTYDLSDSATISLKIENQDNSCQTNSINNLNESKLLVV